MTYVVRKVGLDHVSEPSAEKQFDKKRQIPQIVSTLTREVYFFPKCNKK